jgi:pSer/pThr/pTyr-binding forkhead associated (FHA) protein
MASLCLLDENGSMARRWELGDKPIAVGRGKSADVVIEDATLSRRHFLVERDGESYVLKDLNSQNGTWVDGHRAQATKLHHHDCILAGRTIFLFSERSVSMPARLMEGLAKPIRSEMPAQDLRSQPQQHPAP